MKRFLSVVLILIVVLSLSLTGCGKNNDYIIHTENVIKIGVLASQSEEDSYGSQVLDGVKYASELAPTVNINENYIIQLSVFDINDDVKESAAKLLDENVAAVICVAETKAKSDEIIEAFDGEDTPLLFVDCFSEQIVSDDESFALSVPYSYQSSVLSSYFANKGYTKGVVISAENSYSKAFASNFKETLLNSGASEVTDFVYGEDISQFDAASVSSLDPEFVFIIGTNDDCIAVHSLLDENGVNAEIAFSEFFDKNRIESSAFNNTVFISKLEVDVNNYIGADFLSVYSSKNDITKAEIPASLAYGYDAYMLIYGALMSFNSTFSASSESTEADAVEEVYISDVKEAVKEIVHLGVTDSISFDNSGLVNTNFVYLSCIENSNSVMLNRYNYTNDNT